MIFAGTPPFAAHILRFLLTQGWPIQAVYTQPDRPAGRGLKMHPSAVKEVATAFNLPTFQPETLKTAEAQAEFQTLRPQLFIVAAYGLILPQAILDIPTLGCVNVHASLLPRWRGAAPIARAILAGDQETGVNLMQMRAGLDTGPVLAEARCPIMNEDTAETLERKLTELGAALLHQHLPAILSNTLQPVSQPEDGITYAHKLKKEEARLDLTRDAASLLRQIRAFFPTPIAFLELVEGIYRIHAASIKATNQRAVPGTILSCEGHLEVATGRDSLLIHTIQAPGGKPMPVTEFLRGKGRTFTVGHILK